MSDDVLLSVENLRTTFTTDKEVVRAVDGVSVAVPRGRTLGIVGESGSGKSVTARSILGLVDAPGRVHSESAIRYHRPEFVERIARQYPDRVRWIGGSDDDSDRSEETTAGDRFVTIESGSGSGASVTVEAGWVDLVAAPESVVRSARGSEIAMVFQDAQDSLNPVYTVGNQLRELLKIHRGLTGRAARETAADLLEAVGIPDPERRLGEYPHQFSGGMQQRAVIALALACNPSVLLCDEPTTALDVTIQAQILELLEEIQDERELSIVFITHDMGVIAQVADTVAVMYAGELVERAPVGRLFSEPKHPYTKGLLRSIPGLAGSIDRLPTIEGSVPTPSEPPTYCRYAPRCPEAFDDCEAIHPELLPVAGTEAATDDSDPSPDGHGASIDGHDVACLLYPEDEPLDRRLTIHRSRADDRAGDRSGGAPAGTGRSSSAAERSSSRAEETE